METFLMKNWKYFGRFLGRGRRRDGSEQKAKWEGFFFLIVLPLNMYIQFHLSMFFFYCLQLVFLSNRLWKSKIHLLVCSDYTDTHYPSVSDQMLVKHSAVEFRNQIVFAHFAFTSLIYRCRVKALDHQTQVFVLWLLQKQLCVLSQQRCW